MLLYIAILFLLVSPDKLLLVFDRTHQYKTYWCRNYTEQDWGPHFNQQSSCLIAPLPSAKGPPTASNTDHNLFFN